MSLYSYTFAPSGDDPLECWVFAIPDLRGAPQFWFKASDIATYLQYENPRQAVRLHVREEWRRPWSALADPPRDSTVPSDWNSLTVFVHECGLYALINRSRKPRALPFQEWLVAYLLPTLRREGAGAAPSDNEWKRDMEHRIRSMGLEFRKVCRIGATLERRVAVMPDHPRLRHVVKVLKRLGSEDGDGQAEYRVIRTQKRRLKRALKRLADHESVGYREDVPNAVNVLSHAKEILRRDGIAFRAWGSNRIRTSARRFESVLANLLAGETRFSEALADDVDDP